MQPLLTSHIDDIDQARMTFISSLIDHINKLREEIHTNEVILHSVVKSLSSKNTDMSQLDLDLHGHATEGNTHKPLVLTQEEKRRITRVQEELNKHLAELNNGDRQQ
jgi:hypothetical protein